MFVQIELFIFYKRELYLLVIKFFTPKPILAAIQMQHWP
jgi:hypothetical protein